MNGIHQTFQINATHNNATKARASRMPAWKNTLARPV
jgi:hypothetical protein